VVLSNISVEAPWAGAAAVCNNGTIPLNFHNDVALQLFQMTQLYVANYNLQHKSLQAGLTNDDSLQAELTNHDSLQAELKDNDSLQAELTNYDSVMVAQHTHLLFDSS